MKSCFASEMRITQIFGDDFIWGKYYPNDTEHPLWMEKWFYKEICNPKLKGHNGLDVVPVNIKDKRIFNISVGIIISAGFVNGYGNTVGIWNKIKNICEFHNHLKEINNEIKIGYELKERTFIGIMGNTGTVGMAEHNHLAYCKVNNKCQRLNLDNGYNGWLDPIGFIS